MIIDVDAGGLSVSWQKSFREEDKVPRTEGGDTLALSAFALSSLPNPLARKHLIKEMWESGADVIVSCALCLRDCTVFTALLIRF